MSGNLSATCCHLHNAHRQVRTARDSDHFRSESPPEPGHDGAVAPSGRAPTLLRAEDRARFPFLSFIRPACSGRLSVRVGPTPITGDLNDCFCTLPQNKYRYELPRRRRQRLAQQAASASWLYKVDRASGQQPDQQHGREHGTQRRHPEHRLQAYGFGQ